MLKLKVLKLKFNSYEQKTDQLIYRTGACTNQGHTGI